jgi:two-component system chemotaxis response regulator CheB
MGMQSASAGPVKVLVVDDSVLMQKLMTQIVNATPGFQVIGVAGSAEEGWDAIQELRPDILTLDLELPGRHGLKLLARVLKQDPLPVLIVSAFGGPGADNTIQALELGAIDFIEKPDGTTHTLEGFMKHVGTALQRASASRRLLLAARATTQGAVGAGTPIPRCAISPSHGCRSSSSSTCRPAIPRSSRPGSRRRRASMSARPPMATG